MTKRDARAWLRKTELAISAGTYVALGGEPHAESFATYAAAWIEGGGKHGALALRTRDLYAELLEQCLLPTFGKLALRELTATGVRQWHTSLVRDIRQAAEERERHRREADRAARRPIRTREVPSGERRAEQAYRLLRAILNTAVREKAIPENPCDGFTPKAVKAPERGLPTVAQVGALIDAHPQHLRPVLTLMLGAHLRVSEAVGLQRRDLDFQAATLTIERQSVVTRDGVLHETRTKTEARRVIDLDPVTLAAMRQYVETSPKGFPKAPLFTGVTGKPLTRNAMSQAWQKARRQVEGCEGVHLHDLRHLGLTLIAQHGATIAELMQRGGHRQASAAILYQHAAQDRGRALASALGSTLAGLSTPSAKPQSDAFGHVEGTA